MNPARLLRILMSEIAHLIRVLRSERTIQNKQHSRNEIKNRWHAKINHRLQLDFIEAIKNKAETKKAHPGHTLYIYNEDDPTR